VLGAGQEGSLPGRDFEELARAYWRPVLGFVRANGARSDDEARDRTQDFFVWMIESRFLGRADPSRGRFRAFLKTSLRNFLAGQARSAAAHKRGGGRAHVPLEAVGGREGELELPDLRGRTPEDVLDELWRTALVERATQALENELREQGKATYFAVFRDYFLSADDDLDYRAVAQRHGITITDVSNYLMHAKKRYRALLESAVRETVSEPDELRAELRWLFGEERT
jgi:RNA polymerase sigma-70 factor (ECF subfamily)